MISAAQCRAARAMLNWSQDQLATNAQVARATVADFERLERDPVRNNLFSIISTFEAGGITFIEDSDLGAGLRFKQPELEYINSVRLRDGNVIIPMKFKGQRFSAVIPRPTIEDLDGTTYASDQERVKAVEVNLPKYLCVAERMVRRLGHVLDDHLILTYAEMEAYRLDCVT